MVKPYIVAALRWMWLALLAGFISGAITYTISESRPHQYEAAARLVIGPGIEAINPDLNDLRAAAQLMWTYAEFVTTPAVLQQVIDELDLPTEVDKLRSEITVSPDQTTLWLTIRVRNTDSERAVATANALANLLVAMSPSSADGTDHQIKQSISEQVHKLEQELAVVEARLAEDQAKLEETQVQDLQTYYQGRVEQHRAYASDLRSSLMELYVLYQETYTNQVTLVEAPTHAQRIATNVKMLVALAAVAGMIATLAIVFAFEYFGHTLRARKTKAASPNRHVDGKARAAAENTGL